MNGKFQPKNYFEEGRGSRQAALQSAGGSAGASPSHSRAGR